MLLYHLSQHPYLTKLEPRIPHYKGYNEPNVPRICVSPTINGCLSALEPNMNSLNVNKVNAVPNSTLDKIFYDVDDIDYYEDKRYIDHDINYVISCMIGITKEKLDARALFDYRTQYSIECANPFYYVYVVSDIVSRDMIRKPYDVPDAAVTGELWLLQPVNCVKIACLGIVFSEMQTTIRESRNRLRYNAFHYIMCPVTYVSEITKIYLESLSKDKESLP